MPVLSKPVSTKPDTSSVCALGLDFGACNSKMTVAIKRRSGNHQAVAEIHRVTGPRSSQMGTGIFEFPATFALENGRLVLGKDVVKKDVQISAKTVFLFVAGIRRRKALLDLPGGRLLLREFRAKRLSEAVMNEALLLYFRSLRKVVDQFINDSGFLQEITKLVVTTPNHLCSAEHPRDFDMYMKLYDRIMDLVYPEVECRYSVSEGQATVVYATANFDDPVISRIAGARTKLFDLMDKGEEGFNLLVVDGGSSSLNIQVVNLYYEDGKCTKTQTSEGNGWARGTRGGSNTANSRALQVVEKKLAVFIRAGKLAEGELGAYLQDFERQKRDMDYDQFIRDGRSITLHGIDSPNVLLETKDLVEIFETAFGAGQQAVAQVMTMLGDLGKSFAVLYTGGSFSNPGLRNRSHRQTQILARNYLSTIQHAFLDDHDRHPTSAVSAGAALAVLDMPFPAQVLKKSSIGIQRVLFTRGKLSLGDDHYIPLFVPGQTLRESTFDRSVYQKQSIEYSLVCDPRPDRSRTDGCRILSPEKTLNGPLGVYDLNWAISGSSLPPGSFRLSINGSELGRLAEDPDSDWARDRIRFSIGVYQVTSLGRKTKHSRDSKILLALVTDPATNLLTVQEVGWVPFWCTSCKQELTLQARQCKSCDASLCSDCSLLHPEEHEVKVVVIDEERC